MTEYTGFIYDVVTRTETLLASGSASKQYDVTRLLTLMTVGFAMVYERLKVIKEGDTSGVETFDDKVFDDGRALSFRSVTLQSFSMFSASPDWNVYAVPAEDGEEEKTAIRYDIRALLEKSGGLSPLRRDELTIHRVLEMLRNSFAHGGVHPMSDRQMGRAESHPISNISKIYLVSKWRDKNAKGGFAGLYMIEMTPVDLAAFWHDWRRLVLDENAMLQLESVAA